MAMLLFDLERKSVFNGYMLNSLVLYTFNFLLVLSCMQYVCAIVKLVLYNTFS